jgi:hypothetical protein
MLLSDKADTDSISTEWIRRSAGQRIRYCINNVPGSGGHQLNIDLLGVLISRILYPI